jgi:hypothetical protein
MQYAVYSLYVARYVVYLCTIMSMQCKVYSGLCIIMSMQYAVYSMQHSM